MFHSDKFMLIDARSAISFKSREYLYDFIVRNKCNKILEIGMANGLSSVAILSGLIENNKKNHCDVKLTTIDPFQSKVYESNGIHNIKLIPGFDTKYHELIEDADITALPKLLEKGEKFDLVFIDGWHTFDHVLLNNFYADMLLNKGGFIINYAYNFLSIKYVHKYISTNYNHLQMIDNIPQVGPIYKKIHEKNIKFNEFKKF